MNIWRILNRPFVRWRFTVATDRVWANWSKHRHEWQARRGAIWLSWDDERCVWVSGDAK